MVSEEVAEEEAVAQRVGGLTLVSLATSEEASIVEHVLAGRIQSPVVSLPGVARFPGDLDETIVE